VGALLRRYRALAAFCVFGSVLGLSSGTVFAAGAEVDIHVVDAQTRKAVHLARIVLSGESSSIGYTDANGVASFSSVPDGAYTVRVSRAGYFAASSHLFDIVVDRRAVVEVALAPVSALQVIGHVEARSTIRISTAEIADRSPLERLAGGSLAAALDAGGEFSLQNGALSIDGHDSSQTGVSIDGVPIGGIGQAAGLRGLNADLFGGASISSSSESSLGGNLNLISLEPTVATQTSTTLGITSANRAVWRSWIRGTAGNIGYVYSHAAGGADGPLQGLVFRDASGLTYPHEEGAASRGDLLKLRIPFSPKQSLTLTGLASATVSDDTCDRVSGPLVCGSGPGNFRTANTDLLIARYRIDSGAFGFSLAAVSEGSRYDNDQRLRYVNGAPAPVAVNGYSQLGEAYLTANLSGLTSNTILNVSATRVRYDQTILGAFSPAGGGESSLIAASLRHERHLSDFVDTNATLIFERNFVDKPLGAAFGLTWRPNRRDVVAFSERVQNGGAVPVLTGSLDDPASLIYDCAGHAVFGTALGDQQGPSSVSDTRASWTRRSATGTISVEAARQVQRGTSVATILSGTDSDVGGSFLQAIRAFYATPAACGQAYPVTPADVFLTRSIAGVGRMYQTVRLGFSRQLNRSLAVGGYVRYVNARVSTGDPRFALSSSVTIPGHQLPDIAPVRAGLVADLKTPGSRVEFLALAQFVSSNNDRNLPSYGTLSLGTTYDTGHGELTLALTNLTNAYTGALTSPAFAVALPTRGGGTVATLARPLPARALSVSYSVRTGGAARRTVDVANADQQAETSVSFRPLPQTPPADPYAIDRAEPNCRPERIADVTKLLDALRRAGSEIEASRTRTGQYPESFDLSSAGSGGVKLVYHAVSGSFAISLDFGTSLVLGIPCVDVAAAGDVQHATALGLFSDLSLPKRSLEFAFSPRYGVYVVFHEGVLTTAKPLEAGPSAKASEPLEIRGSCPSGERPLVNAVVDAVRAAAAGEAHAPIVLADGVTVTRRSADVVVIRFPDVLSSVIFKGCTFVVPRSADQLRALAGIDPDQRTVYFLRDVGFITGNDSGSK
jgi:hypothetical protein